MFYYTVYSRDLNITKDGVSLLTKDIQSFSNEKDALIEAIIQNFEYIEDHDPFYDHLDQIGNNYYFSETPQGILARFNLDWETPQKLRSFTKLNHIDLNGLYSILKIQKDIIVPNCNKKSCDYSHKYTNMKRYACQPLIKS